MNKNSYYIYIHMGQSRHPTIQLPPTLSWKYSEVYLVMNWTVGNVTKVVLV